MLEGDRRLKHLTVGVEDKLEVGVDLGNAEEASAVLSVEQVCEDGQEGDSGEVSIMEFRRGLANHGEIIQELFPSVAMADSGSWLCGNGSQITVVEFLYCFGDCIQSALKIHLYQWIFIDVGSEGLDYGYFD